MRQTALIVLLAHIGSFVPASSARIGLVDQIFTRIGSADDLAGGRSTFMVEMSEAANILNNATKKSLVLMDEIGRGTSTFDGLSLAWACAVELASKIQALTLFATHYFELTSLPEQFAKAANVHLSATEYRDNIIFLHHIEEGPASQSYGLQVAKLAGIPTPVIQAARKKLQQLENMEILHLSGKNQKNKPLQNDLFVAPAKSAIEEAIDNIRVDELTPKQALDILYELKARMEDTA